jgi:hypothetical protein
MERSLVWVVGKTNHFLRPKLLIDDRKQRSVALRVSYPDFSVLEQLIYSSG